MRIVDIAGVQLVVSDKDYDYIGVREILERILTHLKLRVEDCWD